MSNIPKDPVMFVSFVNTQLRDFYPNLEDFCKSSGMDESSAIKKAGEAGYEYDAKLNRFI